MTTTSIGDLAQSFTLRRQSVHLKQQMTRLTSELATGAASDLSKHLSGNLDQLADIEHGLRIAENYRITADEALTDFSVMQSSLERTQTLSDELAQEAILAASASGSVSVAVLSTNARSTLSGVVSALNSENAGRALFAGADLDGTAIAPADDILASALAAVTGEVTATGIMTALDDFFMTPGGAFETNVFQGASPEQITYQLGAGNSVSPGARADDFALREALKNIVAATLTDDPALPLSKSERLQLARDAGAAILGNAGNLTLLRTELGAVEAQAEKAAVRVESELASLRIARNELVGIDRFETAGKLEEVQFQLEALYTITARSARLSLVNFL